MARALKLLRSTMSGDADCGDKMSVGCGFVVNGMLGRVDGEAEVIETGFSLQKDWCAVEVG